MTVAIASAAPTMVVRTGTAVRPRPGSRAIRTPVPATSDDPDTRSHPANREGRDASWSACPIRTGRLYHHADAAASASTTAATAMNPTPSTSPSTERPGLGSAVRAAPMGMSGDAATATTTASAAAPSATKAPRSRLADAS